MKITLENREYELKANGRFMKIWLKGRAEDKAWQDFKDNAIKEKGHEKEEEK